MEVKMGIEGGEWEDGGDNFGCGLVDELGGG